MHLGFIEDTKLGGGTQLWVFDAVNFFRQQGLDITILTPETGWLATECREMQINVNIITYNFEEIVSQSKEHEEMWTKALATCDIVICTVHPPRNGFQCSKFAARCIRKANLNTILITKTGTIVPSYQREFYLPDTSLQSYVITITKSTKEYLITNYRIPPSIIRLIYQGINTDIFTPDENRKSRIWKQYPLSKFNPVLGCIGSLERRKGQLILFQAIKKLVEGILPHIHLLIVGDGPDESSLKNKVMEWGLEKRITFIPFTRDPATIYEVIDILVVPSLYKEGLPNVILEALSMETPVVASNIGGISEVIMNRKNGYLIEKGNFNQIVQAIDKIWTNQSHYNWLCKNSRELVLKKFNRKRQFNQFLQTFREIVNK